MRLRNVFLLGIIGLIAISLYLAFAKQPQAFPEGSESRSKLAAGPFPVTTLQATLVDESRPSQPYGDFAGTTQRTLETKIWFPDDAGHQAGPLIIYNHGFSSTRDEGNYLATHLASYGYVVAAANYPLTNLFAPDGPFVQDVVNQPQDVSYIIDTLLAWNKQSTHPLYQRIDPERIGVAGVSLGGLTATLVGYDPMRHDARVKAVASIAGPTVMFNKHYFAARNKQRSTPLPFLMLATNQDALVNYEDNARDIPTRVEHSILVTIAGGSHTGFADTAATLRWLDNPDAIGCFMVMKNLSNDAANSWYELFGTPEQGVIYGSVVRLCETDPLPPAINPLRQQMLTTVAVSSFFDSIFNAEAAQRELQRKYLMETLPAELAEISVRFSKPQR